MILVVFAHVETFMLSIEPSSTFISHLFISFRMPLFFFISGYIAYKENVIWNISYYLNNITKKIRIQLIPTFIFGLLYTYLFSLGSIFDFINNYDKYGYWFTICLLGMFIILYTFNMLYNTFFNKQNKYYLFCLFLITCLLFGARLLYDKNPQFAQISDVFCFHQICTYVPFFFFGYIMSRYRDLFHKFLNHNLMQMFVLILFCIAFYIQRIMPMSFYETNDFLLVYRNIQYLIIGLLGICIVYNLFRQNSTFFTKNSILSNGLQKIGRRTLDIYMIHYFFLSVIPCLGSYISSTRNIIFEVFFVSVLSILVIAFSLFISKILRFSKYMSYYLFGARNN